MAPETTKLAIRLPAQHVLFAKRYAREHGISVTEVIDRYLRRLRELENYSPSPTLEAISGILPPDIDAEGEFHRHQLHKHSRPCP